MRAILTFHGVDRSGSLLSVAPEELRGIVRGVREAGHEILPLRELLAAPDRPRAVALSFDDGFRSVAEAGLAVLREEGAPATLFLTTGYVGRDNGWPSQPAWVPRVPMLAWDQVEKLASGGFAIESHTVSHPDLTALSDDAVAEEIGGARAEIERRLGGSPPGFAYPYGALDARVARLAAQQCTWAVTTELRALDGRESDPHRLPRLDGYYLRAARVHRRFASPLFRGWLGARALLRRLRGR